ncbi:MAG: hypothetical protein IJX92_06745 [Clostridia bacterium]|nr:hypothetical protein [Clostridia bacterium]
MILKLCGLGLVAAVAAQLLGEGGFKGKRFFSVLCILLLLSFAEEGIEMLAKEVIGLTEIGAASDVAKCALKIVGIGYVFGLSSDTLSELGEGGMAKALVTVGRIEILATVFPYFKDMLELGTGLIK